MKLTVLGSGTCVPQKNRAPSSYFLEIADQNILIDLGSGALQQLVKADKDYKDIDYLVLNHMHPDHVSDYPALISALCWTPGFARTKPLTIFAHDSFKNFVKDWGKLFSLTPPRNTFKINIRGLGDHNLENFNVTTIQGNHNSTSIHTKFTSGDKTFVYSGDTDYDQGLVKLAKNSNLLLTECSYPDDQYNPGHATPNIAARIASESNTKHLVVSHLYPPVQEIDIKSEISKNYPGKVTVAEDFMEIDVQ